MKTHFITIVILFSFLSIRVSGQEKKPTLLQRLSLEGGSGYHLPISPDKNIVNKEYAGFNSFFIGANYTITHLWGIRFTYSNNNFVNKNNKSSNFTIQKVMVEATFNILQAIQSQQNTFEIVAHTGGGISGGEGSYLSDLDKMANFQIGLKPLYRITNDLSIHLDAIYVINIYQNQGYNGQYVYKDIRDVFGSYLLLNMGLGVKFDF